MSAHVDIASILTSPISHDKGDEPLIWLALVLTSFARAEQAIGRLSLALEPTVSSGSLPNIGDLRGRLAQSQDRKALALDKRIARWLSNRPVRHLLAHATLMYLYDADGNQIVVTRSLPRDRNDATPDRLWTSPERTEILRQAAADGRSIADHVDGIINNPKILKKLEKA